MLNFSRHLILLITLLGLAACAPDTPPLPTVAPPATSPTPAPTIPTATPLPTRAPLPTEIPREERLPGGNANANTPTGQIRVIHALPDLDSVDVALGDRTVAYSLRYGRASGLATVPAGAYTLTVRATGSALDTPALLAREITLTRGEPLLVVLANADDTPTAFTHVESTAPVEAGRTRLTLVHAIADAPQTTILRPSEFPDEPPEAAVPPVRFGEMSEPYAPPQGDLELNIDGLLSDYALTARPRRSYTLTLIGTAAAPQVVVTDVPVETSMPLTLVHVSRETAPVDVYIDGELALANPVAFKTSGFIRDVVTGPHEITLYAHEADPATTAPLLTTNITITETGETFLALMGPPDNLTLVSHQERDLPLDEEETRITMINAVHEYPILEERKSAPVPLRVGYGQALTRTYLTQALEFEFIVPQRTPDEDINVVELFGMTTYESRLSYILFVTGGWPDDPERYVIDRPAPQRPTDDGPSDSGYAYLVNSTTRNLEVTFNGDIIDGDLPPRRSTLAQPLAPGDHSITVRDVDSGTILHTETISTQNNVGYSIIFAGAADSYIYWVIPITEDETEVLFASVLLRIINVSGGTTRPLSFTYMPAVAPERRLAGVIASPQTVYRLPPQVPRIRGIDTITSGQWSSFHALGAGQYDIHIYEVGNDRLLASVYDTTLADDRRYEVIVVPGGEVTLYDAFVVEAPAP